MQTRRFTLNSILLAAVAVLALALVAAVLWLSPARSAQAASTAPILSNSYDVWQVGRLKAERDRGLYPNSTMEISQILLGDRQTFQMGVVGAAPFTATVTSARVLLERDSGDNTSAVMQIGVCEGAEVLRVVSTKPIALNTIETSRWIDVPLVENADELTVEPSQYLCYTGTITSPEYIAVYMVIQAAVRYWAPPTDQLYLPAVSN